MRNTPAVGSATKIVLKGATCNEEARSPFAFPGMRRLDVEDGVSRVAIHINQKVGV